MPFEMLLKLEGHQGARLGKPLCYHNGRVNALQGRQSAEVIENFVLKMTKVLMSNTTIAVKGASMAHASEIIREVEQRASAIVAKAATPITKAEAYSQVFKQDPQLYARYRGATQTETASQIAVAKQEGASAPSFASELVRRQVGDLYEYFSALQGALQGILSGDSPDKGGQAATALDDFRTAVLGLLREAGLSVPTEKRAAIPPGLEASVLLTLMKLAPRDPTGQGATILAKALRELRAGLAA
jgi:hypothetical protein